MLVDCVSHIVDSYPVTCPTGRYIRTAPLVHAGYGAHVITWVASAPPACVFFRRSPLFLFVRRGFRTLDASDIPFVYGVYGNLQGVIASTPRLFYTTAGHFFFCQSVSTFGRPRHDVLVAHQGFCWDRARPRLYFRASCSSSKAKCWRRTVIRFIFTNTLTAPVGLL